MLILLTCALLTLQGVESAITGCSAGCSEYGTCNQELGRCDCPRHRTGSDCSKLRPAREVCKSMGFSSESACMDPNPTRCLNTCNGRGACIGGWCHCKPGFYGGDCCLSLGPDGKPEILSGMGYKPSTHGPSVYIYEVPPLFNTWRNIEKFDRPLYSQMWKRIISSGHRTLDGNKADYYYIPVDFRYLFKDAAEVLQYVWETWPYWNQTKGARHLLLSTSDLGGCEGSQLMKIRDVTANSTWLTAWGLTRKHPHVWWPGCHRPGLDIVIPIPAQTSGMLYTPLNPKIPKLERNITFYFSGKICGDNKDPRLPSALGRGSRRRLQHTHLAAAGSMRAQPDGTHDARARKRFEQAATASHKLPKLQDHDQDRNLDQDLDRDHDQNLDRDDDQDLDQDLDQDQDLEQDQDDKQDLDQDQHLDLDQDDDLDLVPLASPHRTPLQHELHKSGGKMRRKRGRVAGSTFQAGGMESAAAGFIGPIGGAAPKSTASPVCRTTVNPLYSAGVRQSVFLHHSSRPGYKVVPRSTTYVDDMSRSHFCLAPTGGGHGKRQVLVSRFGCIPVPITDFVLQPFEPELNWSSFSVTVLEADIPRIPEILGKIGAEQLQQMQQANACAARHLWWSSMWGGIFGEDGRYDAFATIMEILRTRRAHPGTSPDEYSSVDERWKAFATCSLPGNAVADTPSALCSYSTDKDLQHLAPTQFCDGPSAFGKYGIPGGAICQGSPNIASCPRPGD